MKKNGATVLSVSYTDALRNKNTKSPFFEIKTLEHQLREFTYLPHRHDCYLILFVTQGRGICMIDFVTYDVKPFTAFFITPGQMHSWELSDDAKGFAIFFTLTFYKMQKAEKNITDFPFFNILNNPCCLHLNEQNDASIIVTFQEMIRESSMNQYGRDDILRNCLDILLIRLSRYHQQNRIPRQTLMLISQIRRLESLIDKHFRELKLPRDYAERMNVTPKHLNDICKRALNKTISDLIHERLVLEAKRMLVYTDMTIKQVAINLEFNDRSYFIRFFKKRMGITPERFRRSLSMIPHNP